MALDDSKMTRFQSKKVLQKDDTQNEKIVKFETSRVKSIYDK